MNKITAILCVLIVYTSASAHAESGYADKYLDYGYKYQNKYLNPSENGRGSSNDSYWTRDAYGTPQRSDSCYWTEDAFGVLRRVCGD